MSKSLGNFYTLRDLLAQGYSPEAIRYLLLSVPHRKQLNFTMEGLKQAASAIDRLENFRFRISNGSFPEGTNEAIASKTSGFAEALRGALDDDLNTAQALGVLFELVRDINIAVDTEEFRAGNVQPALQCLKEADGIFEILKRDSDVFAGARGTPVNGLSAEEIERRIEARRKARQERQFAVADQIRNELEATGILIEDTKEGVRWRRK